MKKLMWSLAVFALFSLSLDAALYRGQKLYVVKCKKCHGLGQVFITSKSQREWQALMRNKGAAVANFHINNEEAADAAEYFKGKNWKRHSRHLREFMIEYAADSGNIPACE
jgi:mono/diheme cytochrome c family protein